MMDGYKVNAKGHLVPVEQIQPVDLLRDDFVLKAVTSANQLSAAMTTTKTSITADMQAFLELSAERYGVKLGGEKGNIQLKSFDGKFMVERSVSDRIEFDERLQTAKILVDKCLREWTKFSPTEVQALIADAFQVDKKGKINTRRVLGLRKLKIEHPEWQEAMRAISDAITITDTCEYLRFYERDENGKYQQIPIDFAAI
jgi:hypothetical protein